MTLSIDASTGKLLVNASGKLCTDCCNAGNPCRNCYATATPARVYVTFSGISTPPEGVCLYDAGIESKTASSIVGVPDINGTEFTLTQSETDPCHYTYETAIPTCTITEYTGITGTPLTCTEEVLRTTDYIGMIMEVGISSSGIQARCYLTQTYPFTEGFRAHLFAGTIEPHGGDCATLISNSNQYDSYYVIGRHLYTCIGIGGTAEIRFR